MLRFSAVFTAAISPIRALCVTNASKRFLSLFGSSVHGLRLLTGKPDSFESVWGVLTRSGVCTRSSRVVRVRIPHYLFVYLTISKCSNLIIIF